MATSYIIVTQAPTSFTTNTFVTSASTTVANSSDWANNGTGTYTYSGSTPKKFIVHLDFEATSLANDDHRIMIIKNEVFNTVNTGTNYENMAVQEWWDGPGGYTSLRITQSSQPFGLVSGDYIRLRWQSGSNSPSCTCNLKLIITDTNA